MNNSIQLGLVFKGAQNTINIQFSRDRSLAQFIDWIYDNFNQFLTFSNKNEITLYSEKKRQSFGYDNQKIFQTLDQNQDIIHVLHKSEKEKQISNPIKSLFINYNSSSFETNVELEFVRIGDMIKFISDYIKKPNIVVFHKQNCLSNFDQNWTLQQAGVNERDELRVQEQIEVEKEKIIQLSINIQDGCLKRIFKGEFSNTNTLNDVVQTVMTYLGIQEGNATIYLEIGNQLYNGNEKRNKTLLQLQLGNTSEIKAKLMWIGG